MNLRAFRLPDRIGRWDHLIGAALGGCYVASLLATAGGIGFMRDESTYFAAANAYVRWWLLLFERGSDALRQGVIDASWGYNHEHPALMKTLFGVSWWLLHERWHVFRFASDAYRFPAMCMAGIALYVTYLFGAQAWGRAAGLVAAVLLALMPRVFFHAHLACFDVPIMTMWLVCVYAHWRSEETGRLGWAIATGIAFGLALETKHNAWLLPAVIVPHALFAQRRSLLRGLRVGRVSLPASLVSMAVLGPIVFLALWPYLWNDTLARIEWWFDFHLHHTYYSIEFLGRNYRGPQSPKSYLPVMVVATVPTITILLFVVGTADRAGAAWRRLRGWAVLRSGDTAGPHEPSPRGETDLLVALALVVPMVPFFMAKTPIFGATKHWLPAYPFLALLCGRGFVLASSAIQRALRSSGVDRSRLVIDVGLFATVALGPLAITAHATPFGLSTYVPVVGGTAGGATLGLNRQFWGYTSQNAATEYLNSRAPRNATVFIHDTTFDAWLEMQREERVRADLRPVGAPHDSRFALVEHELHMNELDYAIWVVFGTDAPTYVVTHDGVPIVSIYRR
ncbi:MAG TPA: glycosyltransferase family 39 protein [Polyangiaceae bacterium]|nr:glycosyltransferase family 39 protein [Polyangiaceae bacterium]